MLKLFFIVALFGTLGCAHPAQADDGIKPVVVSNQTLELKDLIKKGKDVDDGGDPTQSRVILARELLLSWSCGRGYRICGWFQKILFEWKWDKVSVFPLFEPKPTGNLETIIVNTTQAAPLEVQELALKLLEFRMRTVAPQNLQELQNEFTEYLRDFFTEIEGESDGDLMLFKRKIAHRAYWEMYWRFSTKQEYANADLFFDVVRQLDLSADIGAEIAEQAMGKSDPFNQRLAITMSALTIDLVNHEALIQSPMAQLRQKTRWHQKARETKNPLIRKFWERLIVEMRYVQMGLQTRNQTRSGASDLEKAQSEILSEPASDESQEQLKAKSEWAREAVLSLLDSPDSRHELSLSGHQIGSMITKLKIPPQYVTLPVDQPLKAIRDGVEISVVARTSEDLATPVEFDLGRAGRERLTRTGYFQTWLHEAGHSIGLSNSLEMDQRAARLLVNLKNTKTSLLLIHDFLVGKEVMDLFARLKLAMISFYDCMDREAQDWKERDFRVQLLEDEVTPVYDGLKELFDLPGYYFRGEKKYLKQLSTETQGDYAILTDLLLHTKSELKNEKQLDPRVIRELELFLSDATQYSSAPNVTDHFHAR